MTRRVAAVLLITLLLLPSTASATDWVYLQRLEGTRYGACTEYIAADAVVGDGNKITYWTVWVLDDEPHLHRVKKMLLKKEVLLTSPMRHRYLAMYQFDAADVEIYRSDRAFDYYTIEPGSYEVEQVNRALLYAREGESAPERPDYAATPTPRWYGAVEFDDGRLLWNIHSIAAWPQGNPTTVEIIVKQVWNEKGIAARKAALGGLRPKRPHFTGYENLSYTLVNYQFLTGENKMRILSEADYDNGGRRIGLYDGGDWQEIVNGTKDDMARKIALKWLDDGE